jgi:hypothetical protein
MVIHQKRPVGNCDGYSKYGTEILSKTVDLKFACTGPKRRNQHLSATAIVSVLVPSWFLALWARHGRVY